MAKIDIGKVWSLNYRLMMSVINQVAPGLDELGWESKELFVLGEIDEHPHPAELAAVLCIPRPTITLYLKRLEAAGLVSREIDATDLRRHRLLLTALGRKTMTRGLTLLVNAFAARLQQLDGAEKTELARLLQKLS